MLRVHRMPFSTNVERIALAAAFKGLEVEWVDHDPADRSGITRLSGQPLFPVLELPDGRVLADSPEILRWIEREHPDPPLWPADPARRAEADVFVEWFNRVWKVPPNALTDAPDGPDAEAHRADLRRWLDLLDALLTGRDFLLGDTLGVADVVAAPFLRLAVFEDPGDTDPFHAVVRRTCAPGPEHARLRRWIERTEALPRG